MLWSQLSWTHLISPWCKRLHLAMVKQPSVSLQLEMSHQWHDMPHSWQAHRASTWSLLARQFACWTYCNTCLKTRSTKNEKSTNNGATITDRGKLCDPILVQIDLTWRWGFRGKKFLDLQWHTKSCNKQSSCSPKGLHIFYTTQLFFRNCQFHFLLLGSWRVVSGSFFFYSMLAAFARLSIMGEKHSHCLNKTLQLDTQRITNHL